MACRWAGYGAAMISGEVADKKGGYLSVMRGTRAEILGRTSQ